MHVARGWFCSCIPSGFNVHWTVLLHLHCCWLAFCDVDYSVWFSVLLDLVPGTLSVGLGISRGASCCLDHVTVIGPCDSRRRALLWEGQVCRVSQASALTQQRMNAQAGLVAAVCVFPQTQTDKKTKEENKKTCGRGCAG